MRRMVIAHAGRLLRRLGVDLAHFPHPEHATLRSLLARVFATSRINCVLDVGANEGQYGQYLRACGFRGWIVSFEPVASVCTRLRKVASGDARWRVVPHALGAADAATSIHVTAGTGFSSFLTPDPARSLHFALHNTVVRTEVVEVKRLDRVLDACLVGIPDPRLYLKMDTQGFDPEVFAGAAGVLDRIIALQTEVSLHSIYLNMKSALTVLPVFMTHGFDIVDMIPVSRAGNGLSAVEMDCVMVRRGESFGLPH
jgi:FkbM family methyltransferase